MEETGDRVPLRVHLQDLVLHERALEDHEPVADGRDVLRERGGRVDPQLPAERRGVPVLVRVEDLRCFFRLSRADFTLEIRNISVEF